MAKADGETFLSLALSLSRFSVSSALDPKIRIYIFMQRSRAFVDPTEGDDATSTEPRIVCNGIFTPFRGPFPLALSYSFPTLSRCRIDEHLVSREIFLPPPFLLSSRLSRRKSPPFYHPFLSRSNLIKVSENYPWFFSSFGRGKGRAISSSSRLTRPISTLRYSGENNDKSN